MNNTPSVFDWLSVGLAFLSLIISVLAIRIASNLREERSNSAEAAEISAKRARKAASIAKLAANSSAKSAENSQTIFDRLVQELMRRDSKDT